MFNALDMGPDGGLRALLLALLALADLGNRPGRRCMLEGGNRARRQLPFVKSTEARVAKTAQWLAAGRNHASAPIALMFFQVLRWAQDAGLNDMVMALIAEQLTNEAIGRVKKEWEDEDDEDDEDDMPDMSRGRRP